MKRTIATLLVPVMLMSVAVGAVLLTGDSVWAVNPGDEINNGITAAGGGAGSGNLQSSIRVVINTLLFLLGAVAVIMIVIGGIRYTLSNGDASSIKSARDTILYSVIGLVVAILAYAIVNFVVDQFA